jgi:hypothetical protein
MITDIVDVDSPSAIKDESIGVGHGDAALVVDADDGSENHLAGPLSPRLVAELHRVCKLALTNGVLFQKQSFNKETVIYSSANLEGRFTANSGRSRQTSHRHSAS